MLEGIETWINRQPWPDSVKASAVTIHETRTAKGLNPFTLGQWQKWAAPLLQKGATDDNA